MDLAVSTNVGDSRLVWQIRGRICRPFRHEPLRSWGRALYSRSSELVSQALSQMQGVIGVALRGGAVENCRPVISDLDFHLEVSREFSASNLQELRNRYLDLKKRHWILGEVTLGFPRETSPVFFGESVRTLYGTPVKRFCRRSRWAGWMEAHELFYCGQISFARSQRYPSHDFFYRCQARRFWEKSAGIMGEKFTSVQSLAEALSKFSEQLWEQTFPSLPGYSLRPSSEPLSHRWRESEVWRKKNFPSASSTPWPYVFGWDDWSQFPFRSPLSNPTLPFFLPSRSAEILSGGLHWGPMGSHLWGDWGESSRTVAMTVMGIRERIRRYLRLMAGQWVCKTQASDFDSLASQILEGIARLENPVQTSHLEGDWLQRNQWWRGASSPQGLSWEERLALRRFGRDWLRQKKTPISQSLFQPIEKSLRDDLALPLPCEISRAPSDPSTGFRG